MLKKKERFKYLVAINILCLAIFIVLLLGVITDSSIVQLDNSIEDYFGNSGSPTLQKVLVAITTIANVIPFLVLSILLSILILHEHKTAKWSIFLFSAFFALLSGIIIKELVHRARPVNQLVDVIGFSFPSNHSIAAIVLFSILIFTFSDDIKRKGLRYFFIVTNVLLFLLVGFSRIYLHVHWFSDVIAGFALGFFWFTLTIIIKEKKIVHRLIHRFF